MRCLLVVSWLLCYLCLIWCNLVARSWFGTCCDVVGVLLVVGFCMGCFGLFGCGSWLSVVCVLFYCIPVGCDLWWFH